jgi:peptide/nickel transport system substrate-binding protein
MRLRAGRIVLTAALAAASACGPSAEPGADGSATLVWGVNSEPDYLNPVLVGSGFGREVCDLLFLRLADYGPPPDLDWEPVLAKSWEISDDRRTITYEMRRDVTWHDGVPTTAHDVVFTFGLVSDPDVPYPARGRVRKIDSCEALDDYTVRFRFEEPAWEPVYSTSFSVVPRHLLESIPPGQLDSAAFNRAPVGNGRWSFVEWRREDRLVIEAEDGPLGRPRFDRVVYRFVPEDVTLRTELLTGGVDVFHRYPSRFYEEDRDNPDLRFLSISDGTYVYIGWNLRKPIFADRRVREALTLATDRQAVIDAFRAGFGEVVDVPVFKEHPDFNPNVTPVPYDPERAAQLLDEAGWTDRAPDGTRMKDGRRFEFTYMLIAKNEISEEIATMTQAAFGELGIAVHQEFLEFPVLLKRAENKDFDALILARGNELILDPEDTYHSRAIDGRYNSISFSDPRVDSLIDLAKTIPDRLERRKVWWRYQEVMQEVRAITPLYVGKALYPIRRDKVRGAVMDVRGPFYRLHEWRPAGRRPS